MRYDEKINVQEWNQKFYDYLINEKILSENDKIKDYHKDIYQITDLLQTYSRLGFDELKFEICTNEHGLYVALIMGNPTTELDLPYHEPNLFTQEIDYDVTKVITTITEELIFFWFYPEWANNIVLPEEFNCSFTYQMYCCFIELYRFITKP